MATAVFRKAGRTGNIRKRKAEEDDDEGQGASLGADFAAEHYEETDLAAIRNAAQQRTGGSNPLVQGTRKDNNKSYRQDVAVEAAKFDEERKDAQDRAEEDARKAYARQLARDHAEEAEDGIYKGADSYKSYMAPTEQKSSKIRSGPIRDIAINTRSTTVIDYQPAVCKDYKNTGFCGRGDTCIFLHDRSDVLKGWEIDAMWEKQKAEALAGGPDADDGKGKFYIGSDDEEELPFACLICKKEFIKPIMTRCGHYFCQACALKRFAKTPKCYACGAPTSGIFNRAKTLEKRLAEKKQRRGDDDDDDQGEAGGLDGVEGL